MGLLLLLVVISGRLLQLETESDAAADLLVAHIFLFGTLALAAGNLLGAALV